MPAPKHDWHAIKAEYLAGVPTSQLAKKYGIKRNTVDSYLYRNKWALERAVNGQQKTKDVIKSVHNSLALHAQAFTDAVVSGLIPRVQEAFSRPLPRDPYEMNAHAGGLQKLNDIGRKTFGLDQPEQHTTIVNIGLLKSCEAEVIEVQPDQPAIELSNNETPSLDVSTNPDTSNQQ